MFRRATLGFDRGLPSCAFLVIALAVPLPTFAACLTGPDSVGMETGNQTLSVHLKNMNADTVVYGTICGPDSGQVDPGISGASTGLAEFATDSLGYSIHASIISGPLIQGSCAASAAGSVRYAVRVVSQPGYAGPTNVDIDIPVLFDVSGSGTASGVGSGFSGVYSSSGTIKEDGAVLATYLYQASGATNGASPILYTPTHSVDIDTDYIIQFPILIQVGASSGQDSMTGTIGSAQSSGTVRLSWGVSIAAGFQDPGLSVEFEMVNGPLGLAPPSVGNPPSLLSEATAVPALRADPTLVLALVIAVIGALSARRLRSGHS